MAALTSTVPTAAGVAWTPAAVSGSDTISSAQLGALGCYLVVVNANAGTVTVTVSDSSQTPAGNPAQTTGNTITTGTTEVMYISPRAANPSTNQVTVTVSPSSSVTYVLLPLG